MMPRSRVPCQTPAGMRLQSGALPRTICSMDQWISTDEAARLIGVKRRQVQNLALAGLLKTRRIGRVWLIDRRSAETLPPREKTGRPKLKRTKR